MYKAIIILAQTVNVLSLSKVCLSRKHVYFDRMITEDH